MADSSRYADILKSSGLVFVGRMLELAISFLGAVIVARLFGRTAFGSITVGTTVLSTLGSLLLLGMGRGINRYLPRYTDNVVRRGVVVSAFQITLPTAVVAAGTVFILAEPIAVGVFDDPSTVPVIRVFALAIPLSVIVDLSVTTAQGGKDSLPQVYVKNLGIPVTRIVGVIAVLAVGGGIVAIAWAYWAAYAVASVLGLGYVLFRSGLSLPGEYERMHRELLAFSLPLIGSVIAAQVLSDIDTFLLWFFHDRSDVGIYGVVYPLASLLFVFLTSIDYLTMPTISELHAEGETEEMRRVYQVVTKWIVMSTLPTFVVIGFFPRRVIELTYGPEYLAGGAALAVIATGFFLTLFAGPVQQVISSVGDTRVILYGTAGAAIINIVFNLWLIPLYSYLGAAAATAAAYILMNVGFVWILYRRTGVHPFTLALLKPPAVALAIAGGIYAVTRAFLPTTWPVLVIMFIVFNAAYGVAVLRFGGVEQEEIDLVLQFEDRFSVNLGPVKRVAERLMR